MRAGELRHRITLQQAMETRNSFGEVTRTWSDVATVWASVQALSGREYLEAKQLRKAVTTRIVIRWRDDVTPAMRARWSDPAGTTHIYDIESVIPDATSRRTLTLMCVEVT